MTLLLQDYETTVIMAISVPKRQMFLIHCVLMCCMVD